MGTQAHWEHIYQTKAPDQVRWHSLHGEFGTRFRLIGNLTEFHRTPFGTMQQFLYCFCVIE